jgi:hypothetical protein
MVILTCSIGRKLEKLEPSAATLSSVLRQLAIAFTLLASVLAGCAGDEPTKEDLRRDVLAARNDADAGLEQIVLATSVEDLLARMRIAASEVRGASTDVREAGAPEELEDERDALADRLLALSTEIVATVETFESFPESAASTKALSFTEWDGVQRALTRLRIQGVNVPPLGRHKPELRRE